MRTEPPVGDEMDRLLATMKSNVLDEVGRTRPARRARNDHRIIGAVVAAVLLLGAGSGAAFALGILPTAPKADPEAGVVGSPTAAPPTRTFPVSTEPPGPTPRIGLTCDDVIDTAALGAFMGDAGVPLEGPESDIGSVSPNTYATAEVGAAEQLGALTCEWVSEGSLDVYPFFGSQYVSLSVLPEGLDYATEYVDHLEELIDPTYGDHVRGPRCVAAGGYCEVYGVIGSTWVDFHARGILAAGVSDEELRAAFRAISDPLAEAIATATSAERWVPGSPSPSASVECADLDLTEPIATVIGVPQLEVAERRDGPGQDVFWYAKDEVGAHRCSLFTTPDSRLGAISFLPNGAWAVARYGDDWLAHGGRRIDLPGAVDATAISRCDDAADVCRLDLVVDDDWITVTVPPYREGAYADVTPEQVDAVRAHSVEIAGIVAERIAALSE